MTELYRHLGEYTDVPAGDIGVGGRGDRVPVRPVQADHQPLRVRCAHRQGHRTGVAHWSATRRPATGWCSSWRRCSPHARHGLDGRTASSPARATSPSTPSRSCSSAGATVLACSDSSGYVHDPEGIDLDLLKQIKEVERGRLQRVRRRRRSGAHVRRAGNIWEVPCRHRAAVRDAERAVRRATPGRCSATGASPSPRAPTCPPPRKPCEIFTEAGIAFGPGKAANAGGVATSALEMQQNASPRLVDLRAHRAATGRDHAQHPPACATRPPRSSASPGDLVKGANIAGFQRVARAMVALGLV